jgi:hypothetical protein
VGDYGVQGGAEIDENCELWTVKRQHAETVRPDDLRLLPLNHNSQLAICCLGARAHAHRASFSKTGLSFDAVRGNSSGSTRVSPITVMKFVSPFQRGTTCMWT